MSIIANNLLQGDEGYNISRSLRLRGSATGYLNRTPASAGNRQTWTYSTWIKRGSVGAEATLLSGGATTGRLCVYINSSGQLITDVGGTGTFDQSTAVYRDPSAWYHFVWIFDTTQATGANRSRMYINNAEVTLTKTRTFSQNTNYEINNASLQTIGTFSNSIGTYNFDGYQTETYFIDGQALTPSSFGETDLVTGIWKAKKYGGTYGTNGFYLPFSDNSSTTTLGYDKSGNSNNWTTNNISLTAGTTYDSMTDVPTMSALASNYCVLSPIDTYDNPPTEGNLRRTGVGHGGSPWSSCRGTLGVSSGKWYFEATLTGSTGSTGNNMVGIMTTATSTLSDAYGGAVSRSYQANGGMQGDNSTGTVSSASSGDVIMCAFDIDAGKVWFGKNGTWFNSGVPESGTGNVFTSVPTTPVVPALHMYGNTGDNYGWFTNFGQRPFSYTPPTGFVSLNTFNLPEPSIKAGNKHFDILTWTGDGAETRSLTGLNFQPDFTWMKSRSVVQEHQLYDVVRGAGGGKMLCSNLTASEGQDGSGNSDSQYGYLSSFDSAGFSVNDGSVATTGGWVNYASRTYASWNWKANGTGSSNTAGSITSTVSANPTSGFSVVTYTGNAGNGTGITGTVGHGLGVTPKVIFIKIRSSSARWFVYHASAITANNESLHLDETSAVGTTLYNPWVLSSFNSSTFGLGEQDDVNKNGSTYVAYCFAEVAGYSKFGSYVGNASTDGAFVHLGFKPKFIMTKAISTGSIWGMWDASRNTYNAAGNVLQANVSDAEVSPYNIDILSNGFKMRDTNSNWNGSGQTFIYMAFAENPQKYSLGR